MNNIGKELEDISSSFDNFTTNQGCNTLEKKLNTVLKREHIKYFNVLVGYFNMSGFNKISQSIKNKKTKILVGIQTELEILQATSLIDDFIENLKGDLQREIDNNQDDNVKLLIELLQNKNLEIRAVKQNNNHSKLYIYVNEDINDLNGGIIIGSSNLTHNGLVGNFELNTVQENQDYIKEGLKLFEVLWENADTLTQKDIRDKILAKLKNYPPIKKPKLKYNDVFIQSLIEYFDGAIGNDIQLSSKINLFKYQQDSVTSAILKLNRYQGAILGDVVGLGKTIIAVATLKLLKYDNFLIIAPPSTHLQWKQTLKDFNLDSENIFSYDKLPENNNSDIIIIDESHNLRNHNSTKYTKIEELCKTPFRKKVLLLSATLQNNSPTDIANQIYLFQDRNSSNLPNISSLSKFFAPLISVFKSLKKEQNQDIDKEKLQNISKKIKNDVLKHLLIRRTREDIESFDMYKSDIDKFPKLDKLNSLEYKLDKELSEDFKTSINHLENSLRYERFRVLNSLNENGKSKYKANSPHISDNIFKDNDLSTLAKYSLIKRFESSLQAFKISLENSIEALENFISDLENDKLYVGKKSIDVLSNKNRETNKYQYENGRVYYLKITKSKKPERKYLPGVILTKDDFENPKQYIKNLNKDLNTLISLKKIWEYQDKDPKLDKLKEELEKQKNKKIIIFTEYKDTLEYLESKLPKTKTLFITSSNRKDNETIIAENFDENYNTQSDDYDILITTDTLAEGVNLHRSNILINYDLPWNSTKLMQRMGRINRIGAKSKTISVSNFKPTDESNKVIGILEKSFLKLQSFHYTLGEDSKILFDDEIVESFGIEEDRDEELKYLQIIRDFKKQNPQKYEEIKKQKESSLKINSKHNLDIHFFKIKTISYFYKQENNNWENIDFLSFIKNIEHIENPIITKSKIDKSINHHTILLNTDNSTKNDFNTKLTKKDNNAIDLLQKWYENDDINEATFDKIKGLIMDKTLKTLSSDILSLKNKKNIQDELNKLQAPNQIKKEIIAMQDIKTKIFISLKESK